MSIVDRWLLPDGVEDVLPPQARKLEAVRRRLLDLYETWGYEYVIPPMVEYLESLLTGTGRDLDLKTFKVVDLLTGRTMGVRADITPQVARIDAHSLNRPGVTRLCYAGTVVQSQADNMLASRIPLSVGAELFGDNSIQADIEIVSLMIQSLSSLGIDDVHLDLGDVSIFRQLTSRLSLTDDQEQLLFEGVQNKAIAELKSLGEQFNLRAADVELLCTLPDLAGDISTLDRAASLFAGDASILASIENLRSVAVKVTERFPELDLYFDLGELRGYAYHTGIVFAAYSGSQVVAKGGRYDDIGKVFGRDKRGATGFSVNVRNLVDQAENGGEKAETVAVRDGAIDEAGCWQEMQRLRDEGYLVMESGDDADYFLEFSDGKWQLVPTKR